MPDQPIHNMDRATWDSIARFNRPTAPTIQAPAPPVDPITPEHEAGWAASGWTPEAIDMIKRLHASGLPIRLAAVAAKDMMGLNSQAPNEWETFEQEHPVRANTKKLLTHAVKGAGSALAAPLHTPDVEKISAHKMLKEYLQAQDLQRATDSEKEGLWMLARMPGAPLAGQPVYGGPTAGAGMNAAFVAQDNAAYQGRRR